METSTIVVTLNDKYSNVPFFDPNSKIKRVIISGKIKHINNMLFYGWENLTEIILENGVESIGDFVFAYCTNLKKIFIPDSVKFISNTAFYGCIKLEKVTFQNSNDAFKRKFYLNYIKLKLMLLSLTSKKYNDTFNGNLIYNGGNVQKIEDFDNHGNIMIDKNKDNNFIPWTIMGKDIDNNFTYQPNYVENFVLANDDKEKLLEIVRQNPEFEIDNQGNIFYCGNLMTPLQVEALLKNIEKNDFFKKMS